MQFDYSSFAAYYLALSRFVEASRRAGKLELAPKMLSQAEKASKDKSKPDTGLSYCKGIYEWFTGNGSTAIKHLYAVRNDPQFGLKACTLIIEICVSSNNPAEVTIDETFESVNTYV